MDTLDLARLEFAVTTSLHFLFVALTLGLAPLVALMQTLWVARGDPIYERLTKFWGQIYVINYALGIIAGLMLEFQFSLNWSGLTHVAGEVFGAPMAMETLVAFFVETTFLGLWIFGWGRLPRMVHLATFYAVGAAALTSAYFIMVANGFLQNPVGYERVADTLRITDVGALLTNPATLLALGHIIPAALMVGGFFMAGVSAWHFRRHTGEVRFFRVSLRLGLVVGYIASVLVMGFGDAQIVWLLDAQPTKIPGGPETAPAVAEMVARHGPGDYLPPQWVLVALSAMITVGYLYVFAGWVPLAFLTGPRLERRRFLLGIGVWTIPLPFVTVVLGWLVREVGRQPWVIYDVLLTGEAVSPAGRNAVLASFIAFTTAYVALVVTGYLLIAGAVRRGPGAAMLGRTLGEVDDPPAPAL